MGGSVLMLALPGVLVVSGGLLAIFWHVVRARGGKRWRDLPAALWMFAFPVFACFYVMSLSSGIASWGPLAALNNEAVHVLMMIGLPTVVTWALEWNAFRSAGRTLTAWLLVPGLGCAALAFVLDGGGLGWLFAIVLWHTWHGLALSATAEELLQRRRPTDCLVCGYSLRGLPSGICPECGEPSGRANRPA